jgi:ankyrin repeat protein
MTALESASQGGQIEAVRLLLEKGSSTKTKAEVSAVRAVHVGYGGGN